MVQLKCNVFYNRYISKHCFVESITYYSQNCFSHLVPSPIRLKADNTKSTSITISWQPPHDINSIIRGYQVSYTPHGETECLHDVVGDTTSTELTSLKPHTKYEIF